jgi:uncharacterized cupredoxin-like copper-binding protein
MSDDSENRVEQWIRVPDKSTLIITAKGTTATQSVLATIDAQDGDNNVTDEPINTVTGAPFKMKIRQGMRYSVDVILVWQTQATATVTAEIRTPEDERYGDLYSIDLDGEKGAEEFVSLFVFAVKK